MGGDPSAAADQFDHRALIDVGVPPLLPQERRGKQAGHRATYDDGATPAPRRRGKRNRHPRIGRGTKNDTPPAGASEGSLRHHNSAASSVAWPRQGLVEREGGLR